MSISTVESPAARSSGHRLSALLAGACYLLALLFPVAVIYCLLTNSPETLLRDAGFPPQVLVVSIAGWQRVALVLLGEIPVLWVSYGLMRAGHCFRRFARGEIFTAATVRDLRGFAIGVFTSGVASVIVFPLLNVILTASEGAGRIVFSLHVGSHELLALLFGGIVWQIASVMTRATELARENAQFV